MPAVYELHPVERCNMCGSASARVLGRRLSASQGLRPTRRVGVAATVKRCRDCGLVYCDPLPLPVDISQHYGTPPQDYWNADYFDDDPGYFAYAVDIYRSLDGTIGRALDIGAGIGKSMRALIAAGMDAYGCEPGAEFRQAAIEQGGIAEDRIQLAAVDSADYESASFDFVTFGAVLEHVPDPAGALRKALGWCKPGGLVHIEVPSSDWLTARIFNRVYRAQGLDYVTNLSPMHPPYHLYEFTPASFEATTARDGHTVALIRRLPGESFLPGPDRVWQALQRRVGGQMQLEVWLRCAAARRRPGRLSPNRPRS